MEKEPGKHVEPESLRMGDSVLIWSGTKNPLEDFRTRVALAAMAAGFDLISDKGFQQSFAADAVTEEELEESRVVKWLWNGSRKATFRPAFEQETISLQEFERRFSDLEWCEANPDHPVSYMRIFLEKLKDGLAKISSLEPALRHYRDEAVATAPASATEEEIDELFSELNSKT